VASCILIDLWKHKILIACRLEFKCTNNIVEYQALVQGLKKAIDIKVHCLNVFGDS
jgi:ribonuclease HI